jgi:sugar lactone lactonase YvrE
MREVRPGWDVLPIYEIPHPPGPKCIGENNDLYYVDNLNYVVMKMDEFGVHTEYINTSMPLSDIIYQPNHNRLLGLNEFGFYVITTSEITLLKNFTYEFPLTTMTVDPTDDSFYCGSIKNGTDILKFDADGNYNMTVLPDIQGCSQIILNNNQSILYYTETYLGSFSMMNMTSSMTKVLKTGIGLLGTEEVIGIGVDDNDDLYYMTADGNNRGFYKYESSVFTFLMASKAGMSTLTWSTKLQTFIAAGSAGGCLIGYDPEESEAELLTPIVNSRSIIETHDGKILYNIEDTIYKINESGPTYFGKNPYNCTIMNLILDCDNNIYALLGNDSVAIVRINHDGSFADWFNNEIHEWAKSIHYDVKNYEIILLTEDSLQNETNVYRIPIDEPMTYNKITTFENSTRVVGVTDVHGNIYLYEAYRDTLFRIPDGSIDREIITTDFVDFSDIYGVDVIIEPPLGYCAIENGIFIGRNDDLQMWLLDENLRITFAINNRGIDNSAIYQNFKQEIICSQSTIIFKLIYHKPQNPTISLPSYHYILAVFIGVITLIYIQKRKKKTF